MEIEEIAKLISKLFETLKDLIQHSQEANRNFYQDFAAPAFSDFDKVHQNYIETFLGYRKMIESGDKPLDLSHPVFEKIKDDALLYGQIREKLYAHDTDKEKEDLVFGSFIRSIFWYMSYGQGMLECDKENEFFPPNMPRFYVITELTNICNREAGMFDSEEFDEIKREEAVKVINEAIHILQAQYKHVVSEHEELKKMVLDNRLGK
jgi:hypothetical protein